MGWKSPPRVRAGAGLLERRWWPWLHVRLAGIRARMDENAFGEADCGQESRVVILQEGEERCVGEIGARMMWMEEERGYEVGEKQRWMNTSGLSRLVRVFDFDGPAPPPI